MAVGILPCIVLKAIILESYENRAVDVQIARLQNQCKILSDQIGAGGYADAQMPETLLVELTHLADVCNGRILLVNGQYEITEDTFDLDTGKILVSENVMQCFEGKETKIYDAKQRYIEVTCPVYAPDGSRVAGVLLTSIPADFVLESMDALNHIAWVAVGVIALLVATLAAALGPVMVRPFARITSSIEAVNEGYDANYLHENAYTETTLISEAFTYSLASAFRISILSPGMPMTLLT